MLTSPFIYIEKRALGKVNNMTTGGRNPKPSHAGLPWPCEVTQLLSQFLDPKTLAVASCVSKSWHAVFSSDHLWRPICHSHFPSSLHLTTSNRSLSPRHLFLLLHAASKRCSHPPPASPLLPLRRLVFTVDVFQSGAPVFSLAEPGEALLWAHNIFRFDVPLIGAHLDVSEAIRVVWTAVTVGCEEAFVLMDYAGKGRPIGGEELWVSERLPCASSCCHVGCGSGDLEAQVFMELRDEGRGEGKRSVARASFGLMNSKEWRYVKVENGLLYLQSFLLPCRN